MCSTATRSFLGSGVLLASGNIPERVRPSDPERRWVSLMLRACPSFNDTCSSTASPNVRLLTLCAGDDLLDTYTHECGTAYGRLATWVQGQYGTSWRRLLRPNQNSTPTMTQPTQTSIRAGRLNLIWPHENRIVSNPYSNP